MPRLHLQWGSAQGWPTFICVISEYHGATTRSGATRMIDRRSRLTLPRRGRMRRSGGKAQSSFLGHGSCADKEKIAISPLIHIFKHLAVTRQRGQGPSPLSPLPSAHPAVCGNRWAARLSSSGETLCFRVALHSEDSSPSSHRSLRSQWLPPHGHHTPPDVWQGG